MTGKRLKTWVGAIGLAVLLGVLFSGGRGVQRVDAVPKESYEGLETFTNILSIIQKNYVDEVQTKQLIEGAINGMLAALDPHSAYLTPDLYRELQVDTKGSFSGLGIEITNRNGVLTVVSPIEDTPAYRAGVKSGDQILKIEGEFTKDMSLVDAVKKMRGPKDTKVTLTLKRENVPELFDVTLTREIIKIQSVKSKMLDKGYGYVRVTQFQERTDDDLERALKNLDKEAGGLQGVVLALRNDPGDRHRARHHHGPDPAPRQGRQGQRPPAARGEPAPSPGRREGQGEGRQGPRAGPRRAGPARGRAGQRQGGRARLRPAARPLARAAQELAGLQDLRRAPRRVICRRGRCSVPNPRRAS